MRRKALAGAVAVALAAAIYVLFFAGTDEERIRKCILELSHAVELKSGDTNVVLRAGRVRGRLDDVLDPDVHVTIEDVPNGSVRGRDGVAERAAQMALAYRSVDIDVHDFVIKLDAAAVTAQVGARATVSGTTVNGDTRRDERPVDFLVRKSDGRWRVASITVWPEQGR